MEIAAVTSLGTWFEPGTTFNIHRVEDDPPEGVRVGKEASRAKNPRRRCGATQPAPASNPNSAVFEAAFEIAQQRKVILGQLRHALEHRDDHQALQLARKLCGLNDEQESNPTNSRLN